VLAGDLRDRLARVASRGVRLVADGAEAEPAKPPLPEPAPTPTAPPAADWAAASLTLIVED
jgi:hypothetical protein